MTPIEILRAWKTIAVVGLSDKPHRPSHSVALFLQHRGYKVVPVNPSLRQVLGETCYPGLRSIPFPVEIVDIFRRSEAAGAVVDEAIAVQARAVWMQLGVIDEAAARRARDAGLEVVMDRCVAIELRKAGPA
ncbi:MAG TPA: CoA-binding protein [Candidatus Polarisedimenticolia bacterium]|nr:CoA-binding protein [Candidatus Polarisedimenticolia bacterium]